MYLLYISGDYTFITQCGCDGQVVNADEDVPGNLIRSQRQANSAVLEDALGAILNHFKHQGISIPGQYQHLLSFGRVRQPWNAKYLKIHQFIVFWCSGAPDFKRLILRVKPTFMTRFNRATFLQCNFSLEIPEILSQNHIRYHWLSVSWISKIIIVRYSLTCAIGLWFMLHNHLCWELRGAKAVQYICCQLIWRAGQV